jgi:hypothetical protein
MSKKYCEKRRYIAGNAHRKDFVVYDPVGSMDWLRLKLGLPDDIIIDKLDMDKKDFRLYYKSRHGHRH